MEKRTSELLSRSVLTLSGALVFLSLGACGVKNQVDDMHRSTVEMSDTTKGLADDTKQLGSLMGEMYSALKQGDSLLSRRQSLQAVATAQDSSRKVSEAVKYFMGFEYQLWSGIGQDTVELRNEAAAAAAREFLKDVQEYMTPGQTEPDPTAKRDEDDSKEEAQTANRNRVLNSLAVAMSAINPKQERALKRNPKAHELSMYSMIQDAFRAKAGLASGDLSSESLAPYVKEILAEEATATLLLQARYNYLAAMSVARVARLREADGFDKAKMWLMGWKLDLKDINVVELNTYVRYLNAAIATRDFMESVGLKPELNSRLRTVFEKMKLSPALMAEVAKAEAETRRLESEGLSRGEIAEKAVSEVVFVQIFEKFKRQASLARERSTETNSRKASAPSSDKGEAKKTTPAKESASTAGAGSAEDDEEKRLTALLQAGP